MNEYYGTEYIKDESESKPKEDKPKDIQEWFLMPSIKECLAMD